MDNKIAFYLMNKKGLSTLKKLINSGYAERISFVVTSKDLNMEKDYYDEIVNKCLENKILIFDRNLEPKDFPGYKIAIGWRWIIEDESNLIVLHDSLLPKYRGFSPLVNMLINGEREIGVTALFASKEYDKGDIIAQVSKVIAYPIKIKNAIDIISTCYEELVIKLIKKITDKESLESVQQVEKNATYSLWRDEKDYYVDFKNCSERIVREVDALGYPFKGAMTYLNNKKIIIVDAVEIKDVKVENRNENIGKVIFFMENKPVIVCGDGLLKIENAHYLETNDSIIPLKKFRSRFGGNNGEL